MAIRTKADLISVISAALGDSSSDETLQLLEDLSDTLTDFETRVGEDWKTKYEQNDEQWRTRYRERFFHRHHSTRNRSQAWGYARP